MNSQLRSQVERAIKLATQVPGSIVEETSLGGGCINHASRIRLHDGRSFFLKWNPSPLSGLFEREAEGLRALDHAGAIRVPRPICTAETLADHGAAPSQPQGNRFVPFIILEYIETGARNHRFFETFGRGFATLHLSAHNDKFGFPHDNYLGSTVQPNSWTDDWVEFWRDRRLGFQLELARKNRLSDSAMDRLGDGLLSRLREWIGEPDEPPCLLHGDLWGGNYLADEKGEPVLIDPAAYYGRREADLAMTLLFGGFDNSFYAAYNEAWPLAEGSEARIDIYKLYHLLNHLNLFGSSYRSGCMAILKRYGGS